MASPHPLIKKDDQELVDKTHWLNGDVSFKQAPLSRQAGMTKSAVNLNVLGPGMESTEMHAHTNAEEWLYVLKGGGTLRLIAPPPADRVLRIPADTQGQPEVEEHALAPGDFVGLPVPQYAHTLVAGSAGIEYLVGANTPESDICQYPLKNRTLVVTSSGGQRSHFPTDQLSVEGHGR